MKNVPYSSIVGYLMHVQVYTPPHIAFIVGMFNRYKSNLGIEH